MLGAVFADNTANFRDKVHQPNTSVHNKVADVLIFSSGRAFSISSAWKSTGATPKMMIKVRKVRINSLMMSKACIILGEQQVALCRLLLSHFRITPTS